MTQPPTVHSRLRAAVAVMGRAGRGRDAGRRLRRDRYAGRLPPAACRLPPAACRPPPAARRPPPAARAVRHPCLVTLVNPAVPLPPTAGTAPPSTARFLEALHASLADGRFIKLVLAKPRGAADLKRATARCIEVRGQAALSWVHSHATRDLTHNVPLPQALVELPALLDGRWGQAHLLTVDEDLQLLISKDGRSTLRRSPVQREAAPAAAHDRAKHRHLSLASPWLHALGVTDAQQRLVPAMARKWKQINKFVEVVDHALADAGLKAPRPDGTPLRVADFGCGKGYLTFALHEHLSRTLGLPAEVTGIELRPELVQLCNDAVQSLGLSGLHFIQGDVRDWQPPALDVMIALHACDTATDHALHLGIRAGASVLVCSPCCHKQIRPQLLSPHPLRPILQHGIHLGQEAEMLTDGLRALLLEAAGFDAQVFEFISLEHTSKNKMILAVRRPRPRPVDETLRQIAEIKAFYGIREHALETLLRRDGLLPHATPA